MVSVNGGDCKCGDGTGVLARAVMAGGRWSRPVSRGHGKLQIPWVGIASKSEDGI